MIASRPSYQGGDRRHTEGCVVAQELREFPGVRVAPCTHVVVQEAPLLRRQMGCIDGSQVIGKGGLSHTDPSAAERTAYSPFGRFQELRHFRSSPIEDIHQEENCPLPRRELLRE